MCEAFDFLLAMWQVEWDVVYGEFSLVLDDGWSPECLFDDLGGQVEPFLPAKYLLFYPCEAIKIERGDQNYSVSGRMTGKRITSLSEGWFVRSLVRRSIPNPSPPVGGRPYSNALT